ncbi:hypothetical protein N0V88_002600 [Collariella sp. IMI 366227]|nr:hypothetical protein N0V88_002600 [Collariella sp. IMI 366227]
MATTLDALRRLVETQNSESHGYETTFRLARPDPNPVLPLDQNPMPPIQSVMGVLQLMKTNPQFESVGFHMYIKAEVFIGHVRKVYFPGGGFSEADFIIVNGGLIDVFLRSTLLEDDASKRETLQHHMVIHEQFVEAIGQDKGYSIDVYVNWTILYNPFTPFIVVFCQAIEVGDPDDLARLDSFVRCTANPKLLYEAALQYTGIMAAKNTAAQNNSLQDFDAYIQSLGMPPLGALGNPGNETLFHNMGIDQGVDMFQSVPGVAWEGI